MTFENVEANHNEHILHLPQCLQYYSINRQISYCVQLLKTGWLKTHKSVTQEFYQSKLICWSEIPRQKIYVKEGLDYHVIPVPILTLNWPSDQVFDPICTSFEYYWILMEMNVLMIEPLWIDLMKIEASRVFIRISKMLPT